MDIRTLQTNQPWTIPYSREFNSAQLSHKHFTHAIIHAMKAIGNLSAYVDSLDHGRKSEATQQDIHNWIADLVNCALRMANTNPSGEFDLERAVIERMEGKNGVKLSVAESAPLSKDEESQAVPA